MKKWLGVVAPVLLVALIVWGYLSRDVTPEKIPSPEPAPTKEAIVKTPTPTPRPEVSPTPTPTKTPVKKEKELSRKEKRWQELQGEIEKKIAEYQKFSKQCQEDVKELLQNPNHVDPRNSFYDQPEKPMKMVESLTSAAFLTYDPRGVYKKIETAVEEGLPVPVEEVNEYMMKLHGCLTPKIESFMMTFFEAAEVHEYPEDVKEGIGEYIANYFLQSPQIAPATLLALSFKINMLSGMADHDIIPTRYSSQLAELERQLMEGHSSFTQALYAEKDRINAQDLREELYSDFRNRERVDSQVNDILNELTQ